MDISLSIVHILCYDYRRELFQKVHYFIHLNLAITLFLAYLMFVVGVEPARASAVRCTID